MKKRYIRHASELVTCRGKAPKFGKEMADIGRIPDGAVVIHDDKIIEVGTTRNWIRRSTWKNRSPGCFRENGSSRVCGFPYPFYLRRIPGR